MSGIIELNGPELWEIVYGVNDDAACSITDEQFDKIAEHIRRAFHVTFWDRIAALEGENEWLRKALEFYACTKESCDCVEGRERSDDLTCGFVARAALEVTP